MPPQDPIVFDDFDLPEEAEQKAPINLANAAKRLGGFGVRGIAGVAGAEGLWPGALINAGGEAIAQLIENASTDKPYFGLDPRNLNKAAITAAGAVGAVPGASLLKQGKTLASAGRSAGMAAVQTAAMKATQDDPETGKKQIVAHPEQVLNPFKWGALDLAGVGLAGGMGALGSRVKMTPEAKAAAATKKAEDAAKNAKIHAERMNAYEWNKIAYKTETEAQDVAAKHGGKVLVDKDGYHVVPKDFQTAPQRNTALKVGQSKKAQERLDKMRSESPESILDEKHTETITVVDPDTGAKVTYRVVKDTPTNQRRQQAIQDAKSGLESKGTTVTEKVAAQTPEGTQTATERFAQPTPKEEDLGGGGGGVIVPRGGPTPDLPTLNADDLGLKVNEAGNVVPERPSILEPIIDEAPAPAPAPKKAGGKKTTALKVGGKKEKAPDVPQEPNVPDAPVMLQEPVVPGVGEPMRKSSRFYKNNPQILEEAKAVREAELTAMSDPTGANMPVSDLASPELKALASRSANLRELYNKHQAAFKAGEVGDEAPAAAATMRQGLEDMVSKKADEETVALLQKDLDKIAADDAIADGKWDGVDRRTGQPVPAGIELRRAQDLADELAAANPKLQGLADRMSGKAEFNQVTGENVPKGSLKVDGDGPGIIDRVRTERGTNKPEAVDPLSSGYDTSQPMMTLQEAAEATDTPLRTLERAIAEEPGSPKRLDSATFPDTDGKVSKTRRIPVEWLNEWIALGNGGPGKRGRPPLSTKSVATAADEVPPTRAAAPTTALKLGKTEKKLTASTPDSPAQAAEDVVDEMNRVVSLKGAKSAKDIHERVMNTLEEAKANTDYDGSVTTVDGKTTREAPRTLTVRIPGDGTFNIKNTNEAIEQLQGRLGGKMEAGEKTRSGTKEGWAPLRETSEASNKLPRKGSWPPEDVPDDFGIVEPGKRTAGSLAGPFFKDTPMKPESMWNDIAARLAKGEELDVPTTERVKLPKKPVKRGRNRERGEIDPRLLSSMGTGAAGSVAGAAYDEENPLRGALIGGLAGAAAPFAAQKLYNVDPTTLNEGVGAKLREVKKTIPNFLRSNLLSDVDSLAANTVVGPVGSGLWAGIEKSLAGDPRGRQLLTEMTPWLREFGDNLKNRRASALMADAERAEMNTGEATNLAQEILSIPGELMATGDLTTYTAARRAGFGRDEALRITLQSQDLNYSTPRDIMNIGRGKTDEGKTALILKTMLPFKNTAANILDAGFDRLPGIGMLANKFGKDVARQDDFRESAVKSGLGGGVGTIAYMLGKNVDPENAAKWRKYLSNFAGPYSMVANAAFSAGLAAQEGDNWAGQTFDAAGSAIGDFPLPTTRIPQELLKLGIAAANGDALDPGMHPELSGPARVLPKGMYPGIVQNIYDWSTGEGAASGQDFGVGGLIRRAVQKAQETAPTTDPFADVFE